MKQYKYLAYMKFNKEDVHDLRGEIFTTFI